MTETSPTEGKKATRFVSGALWMIGMRWVMRVIGLVSMVILARLLTPADFGIIAMAMVVMALIEAVATTGVDLALIREQTDERDMYDAAWTIKVLQGIFIAVCLLLVAAPAAEYFDESRLPSVLRMMALAALLKGLSNIGVVAFRKDLAFEKEFRFLVLQKLLVFFLTIALALWLRDYRALVYSFVFHGLVELLLSFVMHPYRPRLSVSQVPRIWGFSQWLLISRVATVANEKAGQFIVAASLNPTVLGLYHMGVELGVIFVAEIVMPVRRALFPNLSRLQEDPSEFAEYALRTIGMVTLICVPVGLGLHLTATELTGVLLGDKWLEAAPVLRWIAVVGAFTGINLALELILMVTNNIHLGAIKLWIEVAVLIPVLAVVARFGDIETIAIASLVVVVLFVPLMIYFVARCMQASYGQIVGVLWKPLLAGCFMVFIDYLVLAGNSLPMVISLLAHIALGVTTYLLAIAALMISAGGDRSGPEFHVLGYILERLRKSEQSEKINP